MALGQIISQIRKKNSGGSYDIFYLGPEQRYSGALPTSNNNNLEEQLLMGVDRIIRTWHDDEHNTDRQVIEFRRESDLVNYYILDITIAEENITYVHNGTIHFETNMTAEDDVLVQTVHNSEMYYDPSTETFDITSRGTSEEHILWYVQDDGTKIKVSSKHITKEMEDNVVVIKEAITNYL